MIVTRALLVLLCATSLAAPLRAQTRMLIHQATVIDGTGALGRIADVRIVGDRMRIRLTRQETLLLGYLWKNRDTPVPRSTLLREVWRIHRNSCTRTLDYFISSLRRKLGEDGAHTRYLHTVRGVGYQLNATPSGGAVPLPPPRRD